MFFSPWDFPPNFWGKNRDTPPLRGTGYPLPPTPKRPRAREFQKGGKAGGAAQIPKPPFSPGGGPIQLSKQARQVFPEGKAGREDKQIKGEVSSLNRPPQAFHLWLPAWKVGGNVSRKTISPRKQL
eukprot:FR734869.1.p3 GENE.FR734869.1~~FR734869.1.p3  ORF type:complete len:126 (-),score=33.84 FR734869.1:733-1110(-)